ncbi:signal peptidase II [Rothia sp. HMSC071C12]|nr:signal peptidase II [Rothia sp. HMSC071C12]OHP58293.1 signal peptidase II [Rothia sp. HMSC061D12]
MRILSARSAGILALVLAAVVFAIDQGTKYLVVTQMQLGERITVIDGLLWWYSIRNSGAAFSMGENVTWVFTLVMVAAAAVVLYLLRRTRALSWTLALGGLLGGICGNLFDRLFREPGFGSGHVVDFISVPNFAIFNIADSAICVCMAFIVLLNFKGLNLNGTRVQADDKNAAEKSAK